MRWEGTSRACGFFDVDVDARSGFRTRDCRNLRIGAVHNPVFIDDTILGVDWRENPLNNSRRQDHSVARPEGLGRCADTEANLVFQTRR